MRSMTGYGRGEGIRGEEHLQVEIRSLNHRYSEFSIRLPKQYSYMEDQVRKLLQENINRGRVEVNISALGGRGKSCEVRVDKELALAYYNALKELSSFLCLDCDLDIKMVAAYPDVLVVKEEEPDPESSKQALEMALTTALRELLDMRSAEGKKLREDIIHRITRIEQVIKDIEVRVPQVVAEYRKGLRERIANLLGGEAVEEGRLLTEVAYFAEKANITEELVRLSSHIDLFRGTLAETGAIGRKLDFILQEMYREINTIGAKAGDSIIARDVVEIKSELEKIREQVQNVE